jgi:nicotinamidase-related amidase
MPAKNPDLHGNVPEQSSVALLLIDVVNDPEFSHGERLLPAALAMADAIARVKSRARNERIPAIYVNENFGRWRSDFHAQVDHCLRSARGRPLVERLRPAEEDYFVLKPKHSGFFSTTLDTLLAYLEVKTLILTGLTAKITVSCSLPTTPTCAIFTWWFPATAWRR